MSEHAEAPVIAGPIDTLLSMGFYTVEMIRVDMFKTRIGDVNIVAALWPDGEVELRGKADGVADSLTLRRWLRMGTPADDCKAAVLDLWKRCSEHSSSTAHGVPEGSEGISANGTADSGRLPFSELLTAVVTLPSITVDRDELLSALDTIAALPLGEGEDQPGAIALAPVNGSLIVVGGNVDTHILVPILAGEWPTSYISNGTASEVATLVRAAAAAPGPSIRLLLSGDGVHVGEWKIGGSIVEQ